MPAVEGAIKVKYERTIVPLNETKDAKDDAEKNLRIEQNSAQIAENEKIKAIP